MTTPSTRPTATRTRHCMARLGAAALLAMTAATAQVTAGTLGPTGIDASGDYNQEKAACLSGRTQQDRATCLREAQNARADKRRGILDNAGGNFAANAVARCAALPQDDKAACEARIQGMGTSTGSVAGGGLLYEAETVVSPAPRQP